MAKTVDFSARLAITGVNPYVLVSSQLAASLQAEWRKPMPVLVQINGDTGTSWQTNLMPTGSGDFYLYLHGQMRNHSRTSVGDLVTIRLHFNEAYRNGPMHAMPDWFQAALTSNPAAKSNWQQLPPSRQKEVLRYFDGLKSDEAKQRNLTRVIAALAANKTRFMGRDWVDGK